MTVDIYKPSTKRFSILSITLQGHWDPTNEFLTVLFHQFLFSAVPSVLENSISLAFQPFCQLLFISPFCRIVCTKHNKLKCGKITLIFVLDHGQEFAIFPVAASILLQTYLLITYSLYEVLSGHAIGYHPNHLCFLF